MEPVVFEFVPLPKGQSVAVMTLARPEVSNALSGEMIERMTSHLSTLTERDSDCRALVLRAKGKHFSAGADLDWMKRSTTLTYEENLEEGAKLARLFETLALLPLPTLALVQGAVYGGAVGLVASCDWAIALDNARFCLSEVKVGLLPATILPYLTRKMPSGALGRLGMTARVFGAQEAASFGLVQRVAPESEGFAAAFRDELQMLLAGEPSVQRVFKRLLLNLTSPTGEDWAETQRRMIQAISQARVSAAGQNGLKAFFDKRIPDWAVSIPDDWSLPSL